MTLDTIDVSQTLALVRTTATDPEPESPEPEDVMAGWTALIGFIIGILAVALIGYFLTRSLKRARISADEGRYDPSEPRRRPTE